MLYREITGQGDPVVFIHGFTLDHRMWRPQAEYFRKGMHVIAYDARGFGRSPVPTGPYNHHDDLHVLIGELGIESAHIVGLSMGGRVAINFALEYPHKVRTLSLLDAALDGFPDPVDWRVHAKTQGSSGPRKTGCITRC